MKPNGATVKVVNGANDITAFLDIPAAPAITTAPTRAGLTYTFSEGTTIGVGK